MYEREVRRGRPRRLPALEGTEPGAGVESDVRALAVLPWEEHCTECAIPACYSSCPLYEARSDGRCRRFADGFVPVRGPAGEMVSVKFKRWAELMAYGNTRLVGVDRVRRLELALRPVEALGRWSPDSRLEILGRRGLTTRLVRRLKHRVAKLGPRGEPPDYFLAEIHNPNPFGVELTLAMRNSGGQAGLPYQARLVLAPGFRRHTIDAAEIARPSISRATSSSR